MPEVHVALLGTAEEGLMPGGFVKLYGSILDSSVWSEDPHTRLVWITMLAMADAGGFVEAAVPGLARRANVPLDACEKALERLAAPDTYSKSPAHEGRRIEKADRGWRILNYATYRELRTPEQVATAERVRRFRERRGVTCNAGNARETEASASASVSVPEGVQGEDVRGEQMLRASRVAKEREFYALVAKIAAAEDMDGPEVARTMSGYEREGVKVAGKMRPETLSDERLEKSLADGRAWLEALNGKPARR